MYRCDVCGEVAPPRTKLGRIPEKVREKRYRPRANATPVPKPGKKKPKWKDDPGGKGFELVSELKACPSCYASWAKKLESGELDDDRVAA